MTFESSKIGFSFLKQTIFWNAVWLRAVFEMIIRKIGTWCQHDALTLKRHFLIFNFFKRFALDKLFHFHNLCKSFLVLDHEKAQEVLLLFWSFSLMFRFLKMIVTIFSFFKPAFVCSDTIWPGLCPTYSFILASIHFDFLKHKSVVLLFSLPTHPILTLSFVSQHQFVNWL